MNTLRITLLVAATLLFTSCSALNNMSGSYEGSAEVIDLLNNKNFTAPLKMNISETAELTYQGLTEIASGELVDTRCVSAETNRQYLKCQIDLGSGTLELVGQVEGSQYTGRVFGTGILETYIQGKFSLSK